MQHTEPECYGTLPFSYQPQPWKLFSLVVVGSTHMIPTLRSNGTLSCPGPAKEPHVKNRHIISFYVSLKMKNLKLLDGTMRHMEIPGCLVAWKGQCCQFLVSESWDELELICNTTDGYEGYHLESEILTAGDIESWGREWQDGGL